MKWRPSRRKRQSLRKQASSHQTGGKNQKRTHIGRLNIVYGLVFLSFGSLILRLGYLQVSQGPKFRSDAMTTAIQRLPVLPARGRIYDAEGHLLAYDKPSYGLTYTRMKGVNQHPARIAEMLAKVFKEPSSKIYNDLVNKNKNYRTINLFKKITNKQMSFIAENQGDMPGLLITQSYTRTYPNGDLAGHVLGYVGPIQKADQKEYVKKLKYLQSQIVGDTGIEGYYESYLQGQRGYKVLQVSTNGSAAANVGYTPPTSGNNLQLTLDGHVQAVAQQDIQHAVATSKHRSSINDVGAVMLNVKTGGVLSLVSYPYYDPNWFENGEFSKHRNYMLSSHASINYAISQPQYPGSTVKPANLIIGLEHGAITPYTGYPVPYWLQITPGPSGRKHDDMNHGYVNDVTAIAVSSDVFFYKLALRVGQWFGSSATHPGSPPAGMSATKWSRTAAVKGLIDLFGGEERFGLGVLTHIDLPGEQLGNFYTIDAAALGNAYPFDLKKAEAAYKRNHQYVTQDQYTEVIKGKNGKNHTVTRKATRFISPIGIALSGIGQEQQFTPIELGQYVATIANNGTKIQPHLLDKVLQPGLTPVGQDQVYKQFKPSETNLHIKPQYLKLAQQGMYGVTHDPLGTGYYVFHNTPYDAAGKTGTADIVLNGHKTTDSVFIAYAPYNNPQVAVAVMVPGGGYGATTAAPIAKDMLDAYFKEHHEFFKKSQWTNTDIPKNWKQTKAYTIPENAK
ncbi:penicillin-binding protein 2 [Alicyclobacillus sp. SO9]|uniref:peptidoglycan D,D-transpeptidase FtsI family protein n=1 Tax=Alicyclobacillus sp. SO9 TaxID=2665646 RepID=UPI0018E8884B|nr:penicillin-binding transpeptidase domain-containing protein [Alicyclobacillus sp. SO9]QQE79928.1 peptidoglycan glycosyltransferase [Alicyclobacillus sp. SO9]